MPPFDWSSLVARFRHRSCSARLLAVVLCAATLLDGARVAAAAENVASTLSSYRGARSLTATNAVYNAALADIPVTAGVPAQHKIPTVQVLVNQIGYDLESPKSAVVASNFLPAGTTQGRLDIVSMSGHVVLRVRLTSFRTRDGDSVDWGGYFWRGDFSALSKPGTYRAVARIGDARGESLRFMVGKDVVLRGTGKLCIDFFYEQRCGFDVPGRHKACHLDDARLPDGSHIDAVGGWHGAGDDSKLMCDNGDGGVAYSLLKAYDAFPDYFRQFRGHYPGRPDVLDEAIWGALFVAKMQNPRTGGLYGSVRQGPGRSWMKRSVPEMQADNVIGTADGPIIEAAEGSSPLIPVVWMRLAMNSIPAPRPAWAGSPASLPPPRYDQRAMRYWRYLTDNGPGAGSPYLLLAAIDIYPQTGEEEFLAFAHETASRLLSEQVYSGRYRGAWGSGGELVAGALAAYALAQPSAPLAARIRAALVEYRRFLESTADNPFGLSRHSVGEHDHLFKPSSAMGTNCLLLQKAWAAALIARLNRDDRAWRIAVDQLDWVLGKNPYGLCQFEAAETLNPPRYHHRCESNPGHERGAVPGATLNGFVRGVDGEDRAGFDLSPPGVGHASVRTSEPWLAQNMWYLLALSALHDTARERVYVGTTRRVASVAADGARDQVEAFGAGSLTSPDRQGIEAR